MQDEKTGISLIHKLQQEYFLEGRTLSVKVRKENLKKLKNLLKANEQAIADAVYKDFGKSYFEVIENELGLVYAEISFVLRRLNKWTKPKRAGTSISNLPGKSRVYQMPYGNVLVIAPWNYPVQLSLIPVVSAIAAGNTVILKPSEITGNTSAFLAHLINTAFPAELLYIREGGVKETTELLSLKFNKIFFTGSTAVGKIVMKAAAEHLTPLTLELGGKNPTIILPDCDIRMTAKRLVWGKFHNGGQACVSPDHIYVHESIEDKLIQEVIRNIKKMFGADARNSEALPRIGNQANFDRLIKLIKKEKIIYGGKSDRDLCYIEPTVMKGIEEGDAAMQEEVFGPIMLFLKYDKLGDVLNRMKCQASPLALYVFTRNMSLAKKIQKEVKSGGGMINDTVVHFVNTHTPFGGIGDSGMGSYHGKYGFVCFSHAKTVLSKPLWFELPVKYPPYTKNKLRIIRTILR